MLDKQPVVSLPRGWVKFWNLQKKQSLKIMYNSIFIIIPPNHPDIKNIEKQIREMLIGCKKVNCL
jgi:hypothetical protein